MHRASCLSSFRAGDVVTPYVEIHATEAFGVSTAHVRFTIKDADTDAAVKIYRFDAEVKPEWNWAYFYLDEGISADQIGANTTRGNIRLEASVEIGDKTFSCSSNIIRFPFLRRATLGEPHGKIVKAIVDPEEAAEGEKVTVHVETINDGSALGHIWTEVYIDGNREINHVEWDCKPGDGYLAVKPITMPDHNVSVVFKVHHKKKEGGGWILDETITKTVKLKEEEEKPCPVPVFDSFTISPSQPAAGDIVTVTATLKPEPKAIDRAMSIRIHNFDKDETYFNDYVDVTNNTGSVTIKLPDDIAGDQVQFGSYAWNKCEGNIWSDYAYTYRNKTISEAPALPKPISTTVNFQKKVGGSWQDVSEAHPGDTLRIRVQYTNYGGTGSTYAYFLDRATGNEHLKYGSASAGGSGVFVSNEFTVGSGITSISYYISVGPLVDGSPGTATDDTVVSISVTTPTIKATHFEYFALDGQDKPLTKVEGDTVDWSGYLKDSDGNPVVGRDVWLVEVQIIGGREEIFKLDKATTSSTGGFFRTWTITGLTTGEDHEIALYFEGDDQYQECLSDKRITLTVKPEGEFVVSVTDVPTGGTNIYCWNLIPIPFTDYYYATTNAAIKFCSAPSCELTFGTRDGLEIGNRYSFAPSIDSMLAYGLWFHRDDTYVLTEGTTHISMKGSYDPPGWMLTVCSWFDVTETDCVSDFILAVPDVLFSANPFSHVIHHKDIYTGEYAEPDVWDFIDILLVGLPIGRIGKDIASKLGSRFVKILESTEDSAIRNSIKKFLSDNDVVSELNRLAREEDVNAIADALQLYSETGDARYISQALDILNTADKVDNYTFLDRLWQHVEDMFNFLKRNNSAEDAGRVVSEGGVFRKYLSMAIKSIRNHTPWRDPPKEVEEVLTVDELRKIIDDDALRSMVKELRKKFRYIDAGELLTYVVRKDPTFFKDGYHNAVMKTFDHFDDPNDIARYIEKLTPEAADQRRAWFTSFRDELKRVLGDAKGEEISKALGIDDAIETADLNRIFWRIGKTEYDKLYAHALALGASTEEAEKFALLGTQMRLDALKAVGTGQVTTAKGFFGWMKRHPVATGILAGWLFMMGPWFSMDNGQMMIAQLRRAGVIDDMFGIQWDDACEAMKTAYFDLKDNPCSYSAQQNYLDALQKLIDLQEYAESVGPVPSDKTQRAIEALKAIYGFSIGIPNQAIRNEIELTISMRKYEYFALTQACSDVIEPSWVIPLDQVPLPEDERCDAFITEILDGDTFKFSSENFAFPVGSECLIRLAGVNTPEGKDLAYLIRRKTCPTCDEERWNADKDLYDEIKNWITTQLWHKNVVIRFDPSNAWDSFRRFIAVVEGDGVNIGKQELSLGYAVVFFFADNKQVNTSEYLSKESEAKDKNLGVWKFYGEFGVIKCISHPTAAEVWLDNNYTGHKTENNVYILEDVPVGTHTVTCLLYTSPSPRD